MSYKTGFFPLLFSVSDLLTKDILISTSLQCSEHLFSWQHSWLQAGWSWKNMETHLQESQKKMFVVVGTKIIPGPAHGGDPQCAGANDFPVNMISPRKSNQSQDCSSLVDSIEGRCSPDDCVTKVCKDSISDLRAASDKNPGITQEQSFRLPSFSSVVERRSQIAAERSCIDRPAVSDASATSSSTSHLTPDVHSEEDFSGLAIQFLAQRAAKQAMLANPLDASSFSLESSKRRQKSPILASLCETPLIPPAAGSKKRQRSAVSLEAQSSPSSTPAKRKRRSYTHTGVRTCVCEICNAVLSAPASLKTHMLIHSGDKPYPCVMCDASFRHQSTLKRHMCIHTGEKKFICEVCQSPFARKTELTQHQRSHSTARPFICKLCGSSYKHPKDLSQHLRAHARSTSYMCKECNAFFTDPTALKEHSHTHKDPSCLCCEICDTEFSNLVSLTQHVMKNHLSHNITTTTLGQTPATVEVELTNLCDVCGMKFEDANLLALHVRENHWSEHLKLFAKARNDSSNQEHTCKICSFRFNTSSALAQHIKKKHWFTPAESQTKQGSEEAHTCTVCGMDYPRLKSLAQHMKKSHSVNLLPCALCESTFVDMQDWLDHTRLCTSAELPEHHIAHWGSDGADT